MPPRKTAAKGKGSGTKAASNSADIPGQRSIAYQLHCKIANENASCGTTSLDSSAPVTPKAKSQFDEPIKHADCEVVQSSAESACEAFDLHDPAEDKGHGAV